MRIHGTLTAASLACAILLAVLVTPGQGAAQYFPSPQYVSTQAFKPEAGIYTEVGVRTSQDQNSPLAVPMCVDMCVLYKDSSGVLRPWPVMDIDTWTDPSEFQSQLGMEWQCDPAAGVSFQRNTGYDTMTTVTFTATGIKCLSWKLRDIGTVPPPPATGSVEDDPYPNQPVGWDVAGVVYVNVVNDTTPPSTPVVTDDGIYTATNRQLHATWTPSSDPESGVIGYRYKIVNNLGAVIRDWVTVSAETTEVTATGLYLLPERTYYLRVQVYNGVGIWSSEGTSDGIAYDPDAPSITMDYEGEYTFSNELEVTWRIVDKSPLSTSGYTFSLIDLANPGSPVDTPSRYYAVSKPYFRHALQNGHGYHLRLDATDEAGRTLTMVHRITVTSEESKSYPSRPSLSVAAGTDARYEIDLTLANNDPDADGLYVERRLSALLGSPTDQTFVRIATLSKDATAYSDKGLYPNSTYDYRVRAYRYINGTLFQGCYSDKATWPTDSITVPDAPTELVATPISNTQVVLTWRAQDEVGPLGIEVQRSQLDNGIWSGFTDVPTMWAGYDNYQTWPDTAHPWEYYVDTGLTPGTTYRYKVRAWREPGAPTVYGPYTDPAEVATPEDSGADIVGRVVDYLSDPQNQLTSHPRLLIDMRQDPQGDNQLGWLKTYIGYAQLPNPSPPFDLFHAWYEAVRDWADSLVAQGSASIPGYYSTTEPKNRNYEALANSAMRNILPCALMHLLTTDHGEQTAYSQRAIDELKEAIKGNPPLDNSTPPQEYPDRYAWGYPLLGQDNLAVARRTVAIAIGYDWLYDRLSEPDRSAIAAAIRSRGLYGTWVNAAGRKDYFGWTQSHHNHNVVPNMGALVGALAIAGDVADDDGSINYSIARALCSTRHALQGFDSGAEMAGGAWCEGPFYFPTMHDWIGLGCLAMGTAAGLDYTGWGGVGLLNLINHDPGTGSELDPDLQAGTGLQDASMWCTYMTCPPLAGGRMFTFGDSADSQLMSWSRLYFANRIGQDSEGRSLEVTAWQEEQLNIPQWSVDSGQGALNLLWFQSVGTGLSGLPKSGLFKTSLNPTSHIETASMRSAWLDNDGTYVNVVGGGVQGSHRHLDLGSYTLHWQGVRWVHDLGYPVSYDGRTDNRHWRWFGYRTSTESHNTVVIDGRNQSLAGTGTLSLESSSYDSFADASVHEVFADLSEAYAGQAESVKRRISLIEGGSSSWNVAVRDKVDLGSSHGPAAITTGFVTDAVCSVNGSILTLTKGGKTYYVRLLGSNRSWSVSECRPWIPETDLDVVPPANPYKRVEVVLAPSPRTSADITYVFSPSASGDITPPDEVATLDATRQGDYTARLTWAAPADDGNDLGSGSAYEIRWSYSPITDANWDEAAPVSVSPPAPGTRGQTQWIDVSFTWHHVYYFAIRTRDGAHNWSWVTSSSDVTL